MHRPSDAYRLAQILSGIMAHLTCTYDTQSNQYVFKVSDQFPLKMSREYKDYVERIIRENNHQPQYR